MTKLKITIDALDSSRSVFSGGGPSSPLGRRHSISNPSTGAWSTRSATVRRSDISTAR